MQTRFSDVAVKDVDLMVVLDDEDVLAKFHVAGYPFVIDEVSQEVGRLADIRSVSFLDKVPGVILNAAERTAIAFVDVSLGLFDA